MIFDTIHRWEIYELAHWKMHAYSNYPGFQATAKEIEGTIVHIRELNAPLPLFITSSGRILGGILNIIPDRCKSTDHEKRDFPITIAVIPEDSKVRKIEEDYKQICRLIVNTIKENATIPKNIRLQFYRDIVRGFDIRTLEERRGSYRTGVQSILLQAGDKFSAKRLHYTIDAIFPNLISFDSVESDLSDFRSRIAAERAVLLIPKPKSKKPYHDYDHYKLQPATLEELETRERELRAEFKMIREARLQIIRENQHFVKQVAAFFDSLKNDSTDDISKTIKNMRKSIILFNTHAKFESLISGLIELFNHGRWNQKYGIFANEKRRSAHDLRISVLKLAGMTLKQAADCKPGISKIYLEELDLCAQEFGANKNQEIKVAAMDIQRNLRLYDQKLMLNSVENL